MITARSQEVRRGKKEIRMILSPRDTSLNYYYYYYYYYCYYEPSTHSATNNDQ